MAQETTSQQIKPESNTYFSALISQKSQWTVEEILNISKDLLSPFRSLSEENIEPSLEVSMLSDMVYQLPHKIAHYKTVIHKLSKNKGLACDDLTINVFNADCGIDAVAFIYSLINNGYKIEEIKRVRLFSSNKTKLKRAMLLLKKLYNSIPLEAYNIDLTEISSECKCNSLFTINLFPHTFHLRRNIQKEISRLIISSHYIYSHSIFFENISSDRMPKVSEIDCDFYWQDLNICRFYQTDSHNFSIDSRRFMYETFNLFSIPTEPKEIEGFYAKYAVFSNLSFETLKIEHKYNIVLSGLCPGTPIKTLFNQNRDALFFERPFKNKGLCKNVDNITVVKRDFDYSRLWGDAKINITLRQAIEEFPQYSIADGLEKNEKWAHEVVNYYIRAAKNGNSQCYNNVGVLKSLCYSMSNDFNDVNSEKNKEIIDLFILASKDGDVDAMINLASIYMLFKDYTNAIKYYQMASDNGEAVGSYSMGIVYHFGLYGSTKNEELAIKYYKKGIEQFLKAENTDIEVSNCCLNLIILMYENDYTLCAITKEFNKIKQVSPDLNYAYTVIANNLSNKTKDFFNVLKLKSSDDDEPAYVTYNRICALYNGVNYGKDSLTSNKSLALKQLKELANTGCPNWPDWEKYVWRTLAKWSEEAKESHVTYSTYWIKASKANPDFSCAFRTNMASFSKLEEDEVRSIWHEYAHGNGCKTCHECFSYDETSRCCPKAQFNWARKYEKDPEVAKFLIESAMHQGYNEAIQYLAIDKVKDELLPDNNINPLENILFKFGFYLPPIYKQILNDYNIDSRYKLLNRAADNGSRKAALLLVDISQLRDNNYENIYWTAVISRIPQQIIILQKITKKNFENDFFSAKTLAEQDLITLANKSAEQFSGDNENAFAFLKSLAEFYVRGENYSKALYLYKIAASKGVDVNKRIDELEKEIERTANECSEDLNYDYYDEPDYARDSWDAMTDGMYGDMPDDFDGDYDFLGR